MTQREKVLAGSLLIGMLLFGGMAAAFVFVIEPVMGARGRRNQAEDQLSAKSKELADEERNIKDILTMNPRLTQWEKISVPPRPETKSKAGVSAEEQKIKHLNNLKVQYEELLSSLAASTGLEKQSINVISTQPDRRVTTPLKGKEPLYERLAFKVTGRGRMSSISKLLAELHKTPLLHQVRALTLVNTGAKTAGRGSGGGGATLDVAMTVEALMVNGAESRDKLPPAPLSYPPRVLADNRDYGLIDKRNMFTGIPFKPPSTEETKPRERPADVLSFIKLTMISYDPNRERWEATLYDQTKGLDKFGKGEKKVTMTALWSKLQYLDKYENAAIDAKVVWIDERQVIFTAEKRYYRMECGDFLYASLQKPLKKAELDELGIIPDEEEAKAKAD